MVMDQHMRQNRLDLIARKEPAGTCMSPESKAHTMRIAGCILHLARRSRVFFSELTEAEGVKGFGIGVDFWVHRNGLGGAADEGVGRDDETVGQSVVGVDQTFHCD